MKRSSTFGPALSALGRLLALVLAAVPAAANAKELTFRDPSGLYSECQGHCDYHWQCADTLQCIKRDGNQTPVPGCFGRGKAGVNYCADPSKPIVQPADASDETRLVRPEDEDGSGADADPIKALLESANVKTGIVPDSAAVTYVGASKDLQPLLLGNCQGHCNADDHCRPGLRCLNLPGQTYIPGCEGQLEDTGVAVCYDRAAAGIDFDNIPEDSETLLFVGKRYDGKNYGKQLGKCMGDCRVNNDCRGDLRCYEEDGSSVPGCLGVRVSGFDYCYDPNDGKYDPDTTPAAAESKPSEVGGSTEDDKGKDTSFTNPQHPPPSSNLQPKPVEIDDSESKPSKVSISIPDIQLALTFNSPKRIRRLATARNLIINDDIDEAGDLLAIVGGLLGEGIRRLGPTSYAGMLLDVFFVDEVENKGTTSILYQFSGSSIFRNTDDFVQPSPRLMEAAALDALEADTVYDALSQSGNPIFQAVRTVTVTTVEEDVESGMGATKQDAGVSTGGIAALIIVLILVSFAIVLFVYVKRKQESDFWKRPQGKSAGAGTKRSEQSSSDDGTVVPPSPTKKRLTLETFSSPTRTHDTEVAETPPGTPDLGLPPNFAPDIANPYEDDRSIGGDSNWSFKHLGYPGRGGGDTGSIGSLSRGLSKKPTDFVNMAVEGPGHYCEQSVDIESLESASLDGMSTINLCTYPQSDAALNAPIPIHGDHRIRTDDTFNTIDTATIQRKWSE